MARKHQLRDQRAGTVINLTSKGQESEVMRAFNFQLLEPIQNGYLRGHKTAPLRSVRRPL